ncbi:MBL fold metallo-hydrolase [Tessaracoccus flavus]|uniref:MBL fold metallo-hydrolase n=1 Tax=Tessaracoccus flavus TaxID=1610493 RepID=UPI000896595C|nr:MBL fold metallo-hydrolase [Tessaracoccus flavus]SDY70277.1 Glyoxylase, beta-lactamase superfamily II [Tessaracoccus flavus]
MLIQPIQVSPWQANCYLVAAREDADQCIVVDPGITGADAINAALAERSWLPAAIFCTHGHIDHVGDAHVLAGDRRVPVYLAQADQHLLTRPADGLGDQSVGLLQQLLGSEVLPPIADVRNLDERVDVAGLTIVPTSAPGHTKGSTLLTVSTAAGSVVFTGDVLFAGTIGRTDLPGGSMAEMRETLRRIVANFPEGTPLLPGHGQPTILADEIAGNPYLQPESL